jgi:hypothetical protein
VHGRLASVISHGYSRVYRPELVDQRVPVLGLEIPDGRAPIAERYPHPLEGGSRRDAIDGIVDAVAHTTTIDIKTDHT